MIRTRFPRLAEAQHAKLAAELHLPWPPAYRAGRGLERPERHRQEARYYRQTGEMQNIS